MTFRAKHLMKRRGGFMKATGVGDNGKGKGREVGVLWHV